MLFIKIFSPDDKRVIGFEVGNRSEFDDRHSQSDAWVFVDSPNATSRSNISDFLKRPTAYKLDDNGNLRLNT